MLTQFYGVPSGSIGWYILPFALGNFCGPLLLGPLFDSIGRKPMIASTYAISGVLLAIVGHLFSIDAVDAAQLTLCWTGIFFFASAAASAAYLTVSESFPIEARALAIAFFYSVGTALGGVAFLSGINTVIGDSVNAVGFQIAFYYALAGLACAWHFRKQALTGLGQFILLLAWPLLGVGFCLFVAVYNVPTFDFTTKVVGIGGIAIGIVPYLWNRARLA